MRKFLVTVLLILSGALLQGNDDCFTVLVGRNASEAGCVLVAHNEDDRGNTLFVNLHHLKPRKGGDAPPFMLRNGATLPRPSVSPGLFWIEIPETAYADSYVNSNGVALVSNATPSKETRADISNGGIGFMLRRILAENAENARDAVLLAGRLVERFGYIDSGRTLCIADSKEAWIFHLIRGRRWLAQRVPDDHVAVIPNAYTITRIDMSDKQNFLGSPDLIAHATESGWYSPQPGTEFDFAAAYSRVHLPKSRGNYLRQRRAISLLSKDRFNPSEPYPFSFTPRHKIRIQELFSLLRDHYEGTQLDLSDGYSRGSPNQTNNRTICTRSTQYSLVLELGRVLPFTDSVPDILKNRIWLSLRRPDSNAYSPWYPTIAFPDSHHFCNPQQALKNHFAPLEKPSQDDYRFAFRVYSHLSNLVDMDYKSRIRNVRRNWKNFEEYTFKTLRKKEKEFVYIHRTAPNLVRKIIANTLERMEYLKWFQAIELIKDFQN